jgi:hypothetical protein
MRSDQAGISLGSSVSTVGHWSTECSCETSPVVSREEVVIVIKGWLGLVLDKLHDLVYGVEPV